MKHYVYLYLFCAANLFAGCGTYEKFHAETTQSEQKLPQWREFFSDPQLQALIDTGLVHNADLRIASLKVKEAEASLRSARMAYLPSLSLTPQGQVSTCDGSRASKTYNIALSAEWELDLAGRLTATKRGAEATAGMYRAAEQAVKTQLIATIANSYYHLLTLDAQLDVSQCSFEAWRETVRTLEARMNVGEANEAAVTQATANMLSVESQISTLKQQVVAQENSLSVLTGQRLGSISRSTLTAQAFPDSLCHGLPLNQLSRRPDVRQAELTLQSVFYDMRAAQASFYPQITLSGTLGWANSDGGMIVNPAKWLANALGSIVQPLFNKGRNTARLRIAEARQEEALVSFRQQLLKAGAEVNDALTQWQSADRRIDICRRQTAALERTVESTMLLMQHSEQASYLEVLTARQSLLQAELAERQEMFNKIQGVINLYHAVGGM